MGAADERVDKVRVWNREDLVKEFGSFLIVDFNKDNAGDFKSGYTHMASMMLFEPLWLQLLLSWSI